MTWFCRLCNWFSESFSGFCQTFFWQSVGHQHGGACEATYTMASWTTMSHPSTIFLLESGEKTPARNQTYKQTLKKNVDVLRSFGRTFSTFLVSQLIPCFSWFHRFFLGILSFPTYPSVFQVMVEFPCLSLVLILDFLNCHRDFQFHGMKYQIFLPPPKKGMAVHQTWGKDGGGRGEEVKQSESSRSPPVLWLMLLRNPKIPLYSVFATDKAFLDYFEMS